MIAAILVAVMLNHLDRQMLSLIKPLLDAEFGWSNADYGRVAAASQLAIAFCHPLMGWVADLVPARRSLAWGVATWSALTGAQALATGTQSMLAIRVALTGTEAIATPAALKALGTLAPDGRRALSLGLFNMAPSLGAMIGPAIVPLIAWSFGWRWAAVAAGAAGFLWVGWWLTVSRDSAAYPAPSPTLLGFGATLRLRPVWLLIGAKALTDQLWWTFLYWLPDLVHSRSDTTGEWAGSVTGIYVCAVLGSLVGAAVAARVQRMQARRAALSVGALCSAIAAALLLAALPWRLVGVAACAIAVLGHQAISVLIFSEISNPRLHARTGTIAGIAAFAGNFLAVGSVAVVGWCVENGLGYAPPLAGLAIAYLIGGGCLILARHGLWARWRRARGENPAIAR